MKLFKSSGSKPAAHHGAGLPRFHGQIEQLEARTVLAAAFGHFPAEFETGHAEWGEISLMRADRRGEYAEITSAVSHWEDSPATVLVSRPRQSARFDAPAALSVHGVWFNPSLDRLPSSGYVITIFVTGFATNRIGPHRMDAEFSGFPQPIAATSPYSTGQNDPYEPLRIAQIRLDSVPSSVGLISALSSAIDNESSSLAASVRGRDSAFQTYSADSLLLTRRIGESSDSDDDRAADDLSEETDNESLFVGLREMELDFDDVSLDVLHQEREAVDAVFSKLSDLPTPGAKLKDETDEKSYEPIAVAKDEVYEATWTANHGELPADSHEISSGGMVLLAPSGDANLRSYDLIETVAGRFDSHGDVAFEVEVSVGMYQALDIGATDMKPTVNQVPASSASTAARPGAPAEASSEKGVAQPS